MKTAFEKLQETVFKSRTDLITDFEKIKSSLDNLGHVNAGDLTTAQLAKIVTAANEDAPKIESFATKVGKALESLQTTSRVTAEQIKTDWGNIVTKLDESGVKVGAFETYTKAELEKIATAYYEAETKIIGSLKKIDEQEAKTGQHKDLIATLDHFGNSAQGAGMMLQSATTPVTGFFKDAMMNAAEFDQNIANTTASLNFKLPESAKISAAQIKAMTDEAVKLGNEGFFNATKVADAFMVLANQGVSYEAIMGGMGKTVHDVAAANQQDMGETANVLTDIANEMGDQLARQASSTAEGQAIIHSSMTETQKHAALVASTMPQIGDAMTAALHSGRMSMTDFLNTMKYVGPQAGSLGMSFTDVATSIALLAEHGIKGSQAGTGLRRELTNLLPQSAEAKAAMDALGLTSGELANQFFNADGSMKSLSQVQELLHESTAKLGDAQSQAAIKAIFGQYALAAMTVTAREAPDHFKALHAQIAQTGTTQEVLAEKSLGLGVIIGQVANRFDTTKKVIGDDFKPQIIAVTQALHGLMDTWEAMDPQQRKVLEYIALGTAAFLSLTATVAVVAGGVAMFISTLSGLAVAFGIVEAGAAVGIGALAATAGIVLGVIAVVIALGVAIYEIVTHWSQITAWFKQLWEDVKRIFNEAVQAVVNTLDSWLQAVYKTFQDMGNDVVTVWTNLKNSIVKLWTDTKDWLTQAVTAVRDFVVDAFKWMYDHNYYFHDLVNDIVNVWNLAKAESDRIWTAIKQFFATLLDDISTLFRTSWEAEIVFLTSIWNLAMSTVDTVWTPIKSFFSNLWNDISTGFTSAWNTISTVMSTAWNNALTDAKNIFNGLETYFTGLWSKAYNWGSNLVHMVADGIRNAIASVRAAASEAASSISSVLGFHSPTKEGPASDSDKWMPNMMSMFSDGIQRDIPRIQNAVGQVAVGLKATLGNPQSIVNSNHTTVQAPMANTASRTPQGITVVINIEGRSVKTDNELAERIAQQFRTQMSWAT
jgi:TP901 family phage tail tape measure protein